MQKIRILLMVAACFVSVLCEAKEGGPDTAYVNNLIQKSKGTFPDNPDQAISMALQASAAAEKMKYTSGEASALKTIGVFYFNLQKYVEALDYWDKAMARYKAINDEVGVSNILNNIGSVYFDKGDDAHALEYCLASLKLAEKTGDKTRIMSALTNIGSIYHNKKDPRAIEYYLRAMPLCEALGNKSNLAILLTNTGEIYYDHKDNEKAYFYFKKGIDLDSNSSSTAFGYNGIGKINLRRREYLQALQNHNTALTIAKKIDDQQQQVRALWGIANVKVAQGDYRGALGFYRQAQAMGEKIESSVDLKDIYNEMAATYSRVGEYTNAFKYKTLYADVKDTLYTVESAKKLGSLQFEFDIYKKEGEINLLTKEKSLQELEVTRQKQAKTGLAVGALMLGLIALVIYRNYRNKARTNKILDNQKVEIESLLLNILPQEVAKELQASGKATPRSYEKVSVLFSDFRGFTTIADTMSPEDLVEELNNSFMVFDRITEKYHLEKIKTIGDAYMCAGGIPVPHEGHVYNMVRASLEMQAFIVENNRKREAAGLPVWDLRVGIHVGPVVAGVVGMRKYAYDIWGSTVNIASRMESNGSPGRVNISAATYELIKDRFVCTHRGKIHAKNVGEIDMYFVEYEVQDKDRLPAVKAGEEAKLQS